MFNGTLEQEKIHLTEVIAQINEDCEKIQQLLSEDKSGIWEQQKYMHEKVYDMDPTEVRANRQILESMVNAAYNLLAKERRYQKMLNSPYFGRISFDFDDKQAAGGIKRGSIVADDGSFQIYIGIYSYIRGIKNIIYDWRSPIAGMFYDFEPGKAHYTAPKGQITGEINLKRQYKIASGELAFMFESDLTIDDEILQEQLSKATSDKMKNIVATIQKEQNSIIRDEKSDVLIIQGVAGSGKTSIALHRVAYLLYRLKNKIYSENMMIISPNKVFSDYISNVLPELGEEQILQMTFDDIAEHELNPYCEFQTLYEQICQLLENSDAALTERIRFKSSNEFLEKFSGYLRYIEENNFCPETFYYIQDESGGYILEKPFEISEIYLKHRYDAYKRFPPMKRLEMIFDDIIDKMIDFYNVKSTKIKTISIKKRIFAMFKNNNILDLYADFYKYIGREDMYIPSTIKFNIDNKGKAKLIEKAFVSYDDVAPLLYLKSAVFGADAFLYVKHLLIDEMQDYTPTHYAFFNKLFVCKKTILGDINQLVNPFNRSSSQADLAKLYEAIPKTNVSTMTLLKSYRSTTEIVELARRVIPNDSIEIIERHGEEPEIIKCTDENDQCEKIAALIEQCKAQFKSVGIICKTHTQAAALHSALNNAKNTISAELLTIRSEKFENDLVVTNAYLAKGLEFDCVILPGCDGENYASETDRQMLYIGITRALHKIAILHTGKLTKFLEK